MGAEKGSAFLLKVGNGAQPPVFATVAGMRTTQMSVNGEAVNITSKDSGGWRELLSGAGVRSVSVAGSGIFTGSTAEIRLDMVSLAAVEQALAAPPNEPQDGQCWLVAPSASGEWAGHAGELAMASGAGWRFAAPQTGMQVWDKALAVYRRWTGTEWSDGKLVGSGLLIDGQQVVASRRPAIANPSGGTIIDQEARTALASIIATLMSHGLTE